MSSLRVAIKSNKDGKPLPTPVSDLPRAIARGIEKTALEMRHLQEESDRIEEAKDKLRAKLKEMYEDLQLSGSALQGDTWQLLRVPNVRSYLDIPSLISEGVPVDLIEKCTKVVDKGFTYQVRGRGEKASKGSK